MVGQSRTDQSSDPDEKLWQIDIAAAVQSNYVLYKNSRYPTNRF